ncbi:MAG TPA: hypothetical protein VK864_11415 [Longimicrobiales bacterium]|nr:hypothetical protein [Longimicrobiales bacterium]
MPRYRVTIRIGRPGRQYDVHDVDAGSLRDALEHVLARYPADAEAADLLEIRLHVEPEERSYSTG